MHLKTLWSSILMHRKFFVHLSTQTISPIHSYHFDMNPCIVNLNNINPFRSILKTFIRTISCLNRQSNRMHTHFFTFLKSLTKQIFTFLETVFDAFSLMSNFLKQILNLVFKVQIITVVPLTNSISVLELMSLR